MSRSILLALTVACASAFSGLAAAGIPWQHGSYHAYPDGTVNAVPYPPPPPFVLAQAASRHVNASQRNIAPPHEKLCYRFKFDEDLQFIRCY